MRRLLAAITMLTILCVVGCQRQRLGTSKETPSKRKVVTNSTDPFMSISYSQDEIGRPSENQPVKEPDAFDKFFNELGSSFGNISQYSKPSFQSPDTPPQQTQGTAQQPVTTSPTVQSTNRQMIPVSPISYNSISSSNLIAMSDPGPSHLSLMYPSPEYGILKLDKVLPNEVSMDQAFKYTLILTNLTDNTLSSVTVSEALPDNFSFESASPTPQQLPTQLVWQFDAIGPKVSEEINIFGRPKDLNTLKSNTTLTYSVLSSANIRVVKPELELIRNAPSETLLCDTFQVEYVIRNVGTGSARDVKILETLPSGLQTIDGLNEIKFDVGTLRGGESKTFTSELRANRTGVYANRAVAMSSSNTRAESAPTATSVRQPLLAITKSGPERQYFGKPLSYEITVINKGDGVAQNTVLEDSIPMDVTAVEASAGADVAGSRLRWELGTITPNSAKTVRVSYMPNQVGVFTSDTTVNAHCTEPVNSKTTTAVVGIPIIRLDVVDMTDPIEVGGNVTYVITASNDGSAPDHNLRVVCQLEDKLQYVSSTGSTEASVMGRTISFTQLRTLNPQTKATWRVICRAVSPGGVRFKVTLGSDELSRPVEETEATYLYE